MNPGLTGNLTVYDIDLTLTPSPGLIIGGEYNNGKTDLDEIDVENSWNGYMVMAHYDFNDVVGLTGRYDRFNREISSSLSSLGGGADPLELSQQAFAIAPTFALTDGLGFLMELRRDFSDDEIFYNSDTGESETSQVNFAFEMTYSF